MTNHRKHTMTDYTPTAETLGTQGAMIKAAATVAALMPEKPKRALLGNRHAQLVYSVYEAAAKAMPKIGAYTKIKAD